MPPGSDVLAPPVGRAAEARELVRGPRRRGPPRRRPRAVAATRGSASRRCSSGLPTSWRARGRRLAVLRRDPTPRSSCPTPGCAGSWLPSSTTSRRCRPGRGHSCARWTGSASPRCPGPRRSRTCSRSRWPRWTSSRCPDCTIPCSSPSTTPTSWTRRPCRSSASSPGDSRAIPSWSSSRHGPRASPRAWPGCRCSTWVPSPSPTPAGSSTGGAPISTPRTGRRCSTRPPGTRWPS